MTRDLRSKQRHMMAHSEGGQAGLRVPRRDLCAADLHKPLRTQWEAVAMTSWGYSESCMMLSLSASMRSPAPGGGKAPAASCRAQLTS